MTKVIEKLIHNQTKDHLQRYELFCIYQSVFRVDHSTDICLPQLTDIILSSAENEKYRGVILIILLISMFSYLIIRTFLVSLGNIFLEAGTMNCVEFVLGLLLALLYLKDIPQALTTSHTYLHADGTSIIDQHKVVTEIKNVLRNEFAGVSNWPIN